MKPSPFVLYEPTSVEQAVVMLADVADQDGRILAGGQTLVPAMALRFAQPAYLIDINRIESLARIERDDRQMTVYACVRHSAFHQSVAPGPLGAMLSTVVRHIAHWPIRTRGTFCGSVANADPASEWCLVAVTLDATLLARSVSGVREIAASTFFQGFMTTALQPDELLEAVRLPVLDESTCFGFEEISRRAGDFAQAMALVTLTFGRSGMQQVRVGVGGVETTPRRLPDTEAVLEGQMPDARCLEAAARRAAREIVPLDQAPHEQAYRRSLVHTVVLRALQQAAAQRSDPKDNTPQESSGAPHE